MAVGGLQSDVFMAVLTVRGPQSHVFMAFGSQLGRENTRLWRSRASEVTCLWPSGRSGASGATCLAGAGEPGGKGGRGAGPGAGFGQPRKPSPGRPISHGVWSGLGPTTGSPLKAGHGPASGAAPGEGFDRKNTSLLHREVRRTRENTSLWRSRASKVTCLWPSWRSGGSKATCLWPAALS